MSTSYYCLNRIFKLSFYEIVISIHSSVTENGDFLIPINGGYLLYFNVINNMDFIQYQQYMFNCHLSKSNIIRLYSELWHSVCGFPISKSTKLQYKIDFFFIKILCFIFVNSWPIDHMLSVQNYCAAH